MSLKRNTLIHIKTGATEHLYNLGYYHLPNIDGLEGTILKRRKNNYDVYLERFHIEITINNDYLEETRQEGNGIRTKRK